MNGESAALSIGLAPGPRVAHELQKVPSRSLFLSLSFFLPCHFLIAHFFLFFPILRLFDVFHSSCLSSNYQGKNLVPSSPCYCVFGSVCVLDLHHFLAKSRGVFDGSRDPPEARVFFLLNTNNTLTQRAQKMETKETESEKEGKRKRREKGGRKSQSRRTRCGAAPSKLTIFASGVRMALCLRRVEPSRALFSRPCLPVALSLASPFLHITR